MLFCYYPYQKQNQTFKTKLNSLKYKQTTLAKQKGKIIWDESRLDEQPKRKLDVACAKEQFGFKAGTDFKAGLKKDY